MKKKFVIVSPRFDDRVGGIVCLYKLCEVLKSNGYEAYLMPFKTSLIVDSNNFFKSIMSFLKIQFQFNLDLNFFKNKSRFDIDLVNFKDFKKNREDYIVIYPEVVVGNPFLAKNVVRWLLHQPGFHTKFVGYGTGELLVKFNSAINDFYIYSSFSYEKHLKVIDYPVDLYLNDKEDRVREGVAYCIRKGKNKVLDKHPVDAILIDGKSHAEIAEIFKKVKTFISYDDYTAYSLFAIVAGCQSVVVPTDGVSEEQWYPNVEDRYGIAYGMENLNWAEKTRKLQVSRIYEEISRVDASVKIFADECIDFFNS